jgi:hypothetical protein
MSPWFEDELGNPMMDSIVFEPIDGEFDLDAIEADLEALGKYTRAPQERRRFLLSDNPRALQEAVDEREAGSDTISHEVIVPFPSPIRILVGMRTTETAPARRFTIWLQDHYDIKILDNELNDFTEKYRDNLDLLFGPES